MLEIGVLVALGAWVFTQFHLILAVRRIKTDIDVKRKGTETFVDDRLQRIEGLMGQHQASLTAQIPPNVHGELEQLQEHFEGFDKDFKEFITDVRGRFEDLPRHIKAQYLQERAIQSQHVNAAASEMGAELEARLQAAVPDGYQDAASDLERQMFEFMRKPIDPKLEKKDPSAAMVQRFAKMGVAYFMKGREGPPGTSVTYRVTSKSPYGL